ncbi:hypothetical protein CAOG_04162 [Capsaspora owczarzaki ATCC 30864]|uniref:50S ribosomal protein L35 n=1 Tax=Capsaspora owczarzaki (strain ATCC 30864) TaxID=595528 RepID=A0A0D2VR90_CAPO3|nr:hypothetical protein CAOG_04162 [Capsaspora owczarzaki ATCC 30864]KJE93362.1 hypothetical protein CAOG_004162 [Capsaspora owczarzaki ATCC 30864]|eukprot:XP_004347987.1 hypothetical protein CAOG_04162 [Capsaspora owczarzaki ATCC 30864]
MALLASQASGLRALVRAATSTSSSTATATLATSMIAARATPAAVSVRSLSSLQSSVAHSPAMLLHAIRSGSALAPAGFATGATAASPSTSLASAAAANAHAVGLLSGAAGSALAVSPAASPLLAQAVRCAHKRVLKKPRLYKLKSRSAVKRRFRLMANGRYKRRQAGKQHLNIHKSRKRKNRLAKTVLTTNTHTKTIRRILVKRR